MLNNFLFRYNSASVGCVNSFERETVGWHYPDSIGTTGGYWYNLSLPDFITDNKSYKIKVPGGNPDEFFRLENHQRFSQFDTPEMLDATAKGLYIIHHSGSSNPDQQLRLEPADGRWNWVVEEAVYPSWYPSGLPVFKKTGPDRINGYNDSWVVPYSWTPPPAMPNPVQIDFYRDPVTNQLIEKPLIVGDGNDAFRLEKNTVFSPWSNPSSQNQEKQKTWIAIEVVNEDNGTVQFNLYIDSVNCLLASPSKPQNLKVVSGPCGGTVLRWNRNLEPDMVGYNVYRGLYYSGGGEPTYTKLNSSLITDTTFVDSSYESPDELPQNIDLYHRYRITAVDNQSKESVKSDYVDAYFTYLIVAPVLADWNMTSVPNVVCNFAKTAVWPTAITPAYRFQCDTGYIQMNTLDNKRGYWIKFGPNSQNILYSGMKIDSTAMPVNACWNIIGSISTSLDTSEVTYSPSGIRASSFFKYNSGYVATETLEPGGGYWVKSSQVGYFKLKASGGLQRGNGGPTLLDLDRFIIADANGGRQEMFVKNGEGDIELPPDPPEGAFNVRFQTGNYVQSILPVEGVRSFPVLLRTLTYPITVSWNIKPDNGVTYWLWQGTGGNRRRVAIRDSGSVTIAHRISDIVELEAQAGEARNQPNKGVVSYAMDANSPNPFNPSTQIRFQLPEGNNVVLTVFDVLGRKVAELVNGYLEPGYHSVTWDATSVASGVYFARFNVTNAQGSVTYSKVNKLVLMK